MVDEVQYIFSGCEVPIYIDQVLCFVRNRTFGICEKIVMFICFLLYWKHIDGISFKEVDEKA